MSITRTITLKSSDGETVDVEETVAAESLRLKNMIDGGCADGIIIPIPAVTGKAVAKVIEYCRKEAEPKGSDDEQKRKDWAAEFIKVDDDTLFDIALAADYLNIKGLRDLAYQTVGDMMRDRSVEELCKTLNIEFDSTPEEEEEEIKRENQSASEWSPGPRRRAPWSGVD